MREGSTFLFHPNPKDGRLSHRRKIWVSNGVLDTLKELKELEKVIAIEDLDLKRLEDYMFNLDLEKDRIELIIKPRVGEGAYYLGYVTEM